MSFLNASLAAVDLGRVVYHEGSVDGSPKVMRTFVPKFARCYLMTARPATFAIFPHKRPRNIDHPDWNYAMRDLEHWLFFEFDDFADKFVEKHGVKAEDIEPYQPNASVCAVHKALRELKDVTVVKEMTPRDLGVWGLMPTTKERKLMQKREEALSSVIKEYGNTRGIIPDLSKWMQDIVDDVDKRLKRAERKK